MRNTIQTYTARNLDLQHPSPDDIDIDDIAHALANTCRFVGHTPKFYSVAEHSLLCCDAADAEHALEALLHDAAEAYVGDVSTPLKSLLGRVYTDIENRIDRVIRAKYGLPEHETEVVKRIDQSLLTLELQDIFGAHANYAGVPRPKNVYGVRYYAPAVAEKAFLSRFWYLEGLRHA